jgi:hypothetical protein
VRERTLVQEQHLPGPGGIDDVVSRDFH